MVSEPLGSLEERHIVNRMLIKQSKGTLEQLKGPLVSQVIPFISSGQSPQWGQYSLMFYLVFSRMVTEEDKDEDKHKERGIGRGGRRRKRRMFVDINTEW